MNMVKKFLFESLRRIKETGSIDSKMHADKGQFATDLIQSRQPDFSKKKLFTAADYGNLLDQVYNDAPIGPLGDLQNADQMRNVLRHDVDHDIRVALKMGEWERERGISATYCLLHSAWYYGQLSSDRYCHSKLLVDSAKMLFEQGHEINLHNNFITTAHLSGLDARELLKRELDFFDSLGIAIKGTSTHGDALCRKYGYRNFHLFCEIAEVSPPILSVDCPESIRRVIGSVSMQELGLSYEAYGFDAHHYVSDSGGNLISHLSMPGWTSSCRLEAKRNIPRVGVYMLTHPVWWDF
jgi:hypothetical protein